MVENECRRLKMMEMWKMKEDVVLAFVNEKQER